MLVYQRVEFATQKILKNPPRPRPGRCSPPQPPCHFDRSSWHVRRSAPRPARGTTRDLRSAMRSRPWGPHFCHQKNGQRYGWNVVKSDSCWGILMDIVAKWGCESPKNWWQGESWWYFAARRWDESGSNMVNIGKNSNRDWTKQSEQESCDFKSAEMWAELRKG